MAEWLVEEGIAEHRAVRIENGEISAARLDWPGQIAAGLVEDAVLLSRSTGSSRGTLRFANGEEAVVNGLPREASEGAAIRVVVTRAAIAETGRLKCAQARPSTDAPRAAPALAQRLRDGGNVVRVVRRFPDGDWEDVFADAWNGEMHFAGGSLTISPTPAMTLIDIDGALPSRSLALTAVPEIAAALARLDLAGSIGIDFPTLQEKADRRAVDEALAAALSGWPHERTAMNGFGFVQLVARLEHPSLLHRIARNRSGAAARLLLRRAEGVADPGILLLTANPAIKGAIRPAWEQELARRTGRTIRWETDSTLALDSGFAQALAS